MDETTATAQRLLDSPEENLYLEIGRHIYGGTAVKTRGPRVVPPQPNQLIEIAKQWFGSKHEDLAKVVCTSAHLQTLAKQDVPTHELVVSVCGLLDVTSHLLGGAPVITVAVLIVRLGLHKFCASNWESK